MARIRSIKPELLEDERTARLSHVEWRLFVSLLLLADDYGNLRAAPERILGAALWAHLREDVARILDSLVAASLLILYDVAGQRYAHINGWDKHQKVDHPGKPLCPALSDGSRVLREGIAKSPEGVAPDQDLDPDLGSGPSLSLPSRGSVPPDQTHAKSNPDAETEARDPCQLRPGPVTGHELQRVFGAIRSRDVGGLEWQSVRVVGGAASTMADAINADPSLRSDVAPTIALLFKRAKSGAAGARSADILREPSFAFGAWLSQWTALLEEVRGLTPEIPVAARPRPVGEKSWQTAEKAAEEKRGRERAAIRVAQAELDRQLAGDKAVG